MGIIFDIIYLYSNIYKLELEAKSSRKYSNFIMIIIFLCIFNVLLIYSFMAISSYKYPNEKTIVFYFPVRNKYVPLANIFFSVTTSGSGDLEVFRKPIIGFISGYAFYFVVEKLKINITPNLLKKLLKEPIFERKIYRDSDESENYNFSKKKKILMNINPNDSTNTAFRSKESVVEGNEFTDFNKDNIKWD